VDSGSGHITRTSSIAAFYMSIHNNGATADTLIGASSGSCSGMGMQIMGIGPDGNDLPILVIIPAGSTAVLKFQGTRLLCYGVSGGIGPGSNVELTLVFENAGNVTTTIAIGNPPE
jgi:periplasmic copper chaperone A